MQYSGLYDRRAEDCTTCRSYSVEAGEVGDPYGAATPALQGPVVTWAGGHFGALSYTTQYGLKRHYRFCSAEYSTPAHLTTW